MRQPRIKQKREMTKRHSSRPFARLNGQLRLLLNHLEVVDSALNFFEETATSVAKPGLQLTDALRIPRGKKKTLRVPATEAKHVTRHARTRNTELTVHALYPLFTGYLREILREIFLSRPLEVLNKAPGVLKYHEIVGLGSYDAICEHMVEQVFRSLEGQRSTAALLSKILDRTGVTLPTAVEDNGLMYLEMRHLFVHKAGLVDRPFAEKYGAKLNVVEGGKLHKNIGMAREGVRAISDLAAAIDEQLVARGLLSSTQTPPAA